MSSFSNILSAFPFLKHPEGGYFLETYRSEKTFNDRSASTGIYFLLEKEDFSALHRIKSDEMWHFYSGDSLEIIEISLDGSLKKQFLAQIFNPVKSFNM